MNNQRKPILNASDIDSAKNNNKQSARPVFIKPDNATLFVRKPENTMTVKKPGLAKPEPALLKSFEATKNQTIMNSKPSSRSQILNKPIRNNVPKPEPVPQQTGGITVKRSIQHKINGSGLAPPLSNIDTQSKQSDVMPEKAVETVIKKDTFKQDNLDILTLTKQEFPDVKNGWHVLVIKTKTDDGAIKVTDSHDIKIIPAIKLPIAAVAKAGPALPRLAILLPSNEVTIVADSPGVFNKMEVVEPPYIAP